MPYGLPKELQTKENEKWMEECVRGVQSKKDVSKTDAIKICKTQLINNKGNSSRANLGVINYLLEHYSEKDKEE